MVCTLLISLNQLFLVIREYISVIISFLALFISFLSYRSNKEKIDVEFSNNPYWIKLLLSDSTDAIFNDMGIICFPIFVINYSKTGVGYFDLEIIDSKTKKNLNFYNKLQFNSYNDLSIKSDVYFRLLDDNMSLAHLPEKNYGYFSPKDTQSIDLVISPEPDVKTVIVKFKIATKSHNPFKKLSPYPSSRYKTYSQKYDLGKYKKPDYDRLNEDLRNLMHQNNLKM